MDIEANRSARKWSRKELAGRVMWAAIRPLFSLSPRPLWRWRRFLLRCFGAKVGQNVHVHPSVTVFIPWNLEIGDWSSIGFDALIYNLGAVKIGQNATISQRAHLCAGTHDHNDPAMPLIKSNISIGDNCWICADAFVGPDVTIETGGIAAARAVVVKDVPAHQIVGGNPAHAISERTTHPAV